MQENFVRLEQEIPDIQFSLRLASVYNFTGSVVDGYMTNDRVIITKKAAEKLKKIQLEVSKDGYNLVVYDAYRPVKAVEDFIRWSKNDNLKNKKIFYPNLSKKAIFEGGFIAKRSSHSRGSTIDLTLIKKGKKLLDNPKVSFRNLSSGRLIPFYDDNSLDMGSSFDLFDKVSFSENREISKDQFKNRSYLKTVMMHYGFEPIKEEWWHFVLKDEPYPNDYFNFDIKK